MQISFPTLLLLLSAAITSLGLPQPNALVRDALVVPDSHELPDLAKRRGGGGGRGGGSSGGGGGGRSGSSRGGSGGRGGGSSSSRTGSVLSTMCQCFEPIN